MLDVQRADLKTLTRATPTRLGLEAGEGHTSGPSVLHPAPHHIPAVHQQMSCQIAVTLTHHCSVLCWCGGILTEGMRDVSPLTRHQRQ